ncbi:MAG TPA: YggT family protein [Aquihabitans sp.]|jgi:YggT family protein|nr:YggT family protein [Aquihabitans sp.]
MAVIKLLLLLYIVAIVLVMVMSWFPMEPGGAGSRAFLALRRLTEPVLGPVRRVIPPIGGGGVAIDISATLVLLVLFMLYGLL